jgi:hypothetical protein
MPPLTASMKIYESSMTSRFLAIDESLLELDRFSRSFGLVHLILLAQPQLDLRSIE